MLSPSTLAFRTGNALRASTAAFRMKGIQVRRTPRSWYDAPWVVRSWATQVKSISKTVETCAEVRLDSSMCSAVLRRIGVIGTTSRRDPAAAVGGDAGGRGRAGGGGCGAGAGTGDGEPGGSIGLSMRPRMSCLVTRPPMPVPAIWLMSTWCSAAIRRTTGEERARRNSSGDISARAAGGTGPGPGGAVAGRSSSSSYATGGALRGGCWIGAAGGVGGYASDGGGGA